LHIPDKKRRRSEIMRTNAVAEFAVAALLVAIGFGTAAAQQPPPQPPSEFKLMISAYSDGGAIPPQYSCADPNAGSPVLAWSNPPEGTMSFAAIMYDTDAAPAKSSMDFTHWIFWNVPGNATSVPAGVKPGTSPDGITQGENSRKVNGYRPPCPPPGAPPHHYILEIYALDTRLDLPPESSRTELLKAMDGHAIGKSTYVGKFGR
jgi:Raf kinase inhibitor-like YbhB/YbcL family protein